MIVRHALLALLDDGLAGASRLRQQFERRTKGVWPLNMGQVSTSLHRLMRDGLVQRSADSVATTQYELSSAGRRHISAWWATAIDRSAPPRNELVIKLALAMRSQRVDVSELVHVQRAETQRRLQLLRSEEAEGLAAQSAGGGLVPGLVLERLILEAEAEVRWLDHIDAEWVSATDEMPGPREAIAEGPVC